MMGLSSGARCHRLSVTALLLVLCAVCVFADAGDGTGSERGDASLDVAALSSAALDARMAWLAERRALLNRGAFDLDVLLDHLDFEPATIVDFVSGEIAYEDYPGVLRGAVGTLTSRAGNDLDQALLLATLLGSAGVDTRIVAGRTPADGFDRRSLVAARRPPPFPIFKENAELVASDRTATALVRALPRAALDEFRRAQAPQQSDTPAFDAGALVQVRDRLLIALERGGAILGATTLAQPSNYHWVEYRQAASGPWQAVHPIFATGNAPFVPEVIAYYSQSIPEALQQRVRVQAFIERHWAGRDEVIAVTPPWERPAANLSGVTITYSNVPNGFVGLDTTNGDAAVSRSTLFLPAISAGQSSGVLAFDITGNTVPLSEGGSVMAGTFQTMGERLGTAADALADAGISREGDIAPGRYLKRQWLEFTLIRPGLPDRKIVREVARWRGDVAELRLSLARTALLRFETGAVGGAASLDRGLAALERTLYWLGRREAAATARPASANDSAFAGTTPLDGFAFDAELFLSASDAWAAGLPGIVSYRPEPTVVARYLPFGRVDASRAGFDIINANRAVLDATKAVRTADAVQIGVTDTWLEHLMFAEPAREPLSAYERLEKVDESELMLVRNADDKRLQGIEPPVRELMAGQLSTGYLLLVPRPVEGRACEAWWAVSPDTGTTLGMTSKGWGGVDTIFAVQMSEYLKDLIVTYGYTRTVAKVSGCTALYGFMLASVKMALLLQVNEALDFANLGICNGLPPDYQVVCQLVLAAMTAASMTPAAFLESPVAFMQICTTTVF